MSQQKSKRTKITKDWTSLLQEELNKKEKLPEGKDWYTFKQIKLKLNIGNHRIYKLINNLLATGKAEVFEGHMLDNNRLKRTVWYRLH